jgi:hypothetical protein
MASMLNLKKIPYSALSLAALASCLILTAGCATDSAPEKSQRAEQAPHTALIARHSTGHPAAATPAATAPDVRDAATLKPGEFTWHPERAPSGPVVIIVSVPEQRAYVYRNGVRIGEAAVQIRDPHQPLGAGVFVALEGLTDAPSPFAPDRPQRRWMAVGLPSPGGQLPARLDLGERVHPPAPFSRLVYELLQPGASLVVTDRPALPESRTQPGFRIMADS